MRLYGDIASLVTLPVELKPCLYTKSTRVSTGQLLRAAVELAKEWRSDKFLRRLEVRFALSLHTVASNDGKQRVT